MDLEFLGPPLQEGPLPAVFYFALSAHASLHQDPFNQPALFLQKASPQTRIFSITIPSHHLNPEEALQEWAQQFCEDRDPITPFCEKAAETIHKLHRENIIAPSCAVMGLSRGAFIACHLAAKQPLISTILGFAPLTHLQTIKPLQKVHAPKAEALNLLHISEKICNRKIRFYCGNRDSRVGTNHIFRLIESLSENAYEQQIRSSPIELIVGPSVGHQGHGTLPHVFQDGAEWLGGHLGK